MTPDQAYELLDRLRIYFEKTLSTEAIREYLAAIRKLDYNTGKKAVERSIAELEFFPKIAKLTEFARAETPSEGQSPRGQVVNISDFDFWAFVQNDKLNSLNNEQYMRYCVNEEYRQQILEAWREEWERAKAGQTAQKRMIS